MIERRSFYRNNTIMKFLKGETILLQNEIPKCIYSVKSGVVEESSFTNDGKRKSINFEIVGDIFPKGWAILSVKRTLFGYKAFTDCELYVIGKEDFLSQVSYNNEFTKKMLNRTVSTLMGLSLKVDALEQPHSLMKLAYTFRYLCLLYGVSHGNGYVRIEVPLTQQDLSELTGLTRETTNVELNKLKKMNITESYRKYYTVNKEILDEFTETEYEPRSERALSLLRKK